MELQIITPKRADNSKMLDFGLVALTEAIAQIAPDVVGGGCLGGEFGYGAHWDNDVFTMRTFYWGDCDCGADVREEAWNDANRHGPDCYQIELHRAQRDAGLSYWDDAKREYISVKGRDYDASRKIEDGIYARLCKKHNLPKIGCAVHCTCGHAELWSAWIKDNGHTKACALELPNFLHKRTGMEVRWYKWIGRDMEVENKPEDVAAVFRECMESLAKPPSK